MVDPEVPPKEAYACLSAIVSLIGKPAKAPVTAKGISEEAALRAEIVL